MLPPPVPSLLQVQLDETRLVAQNFPLELLLVLVCGPPGVLDWRLLLADVGKAPGGKKVRKGREEVFCVLLIMPYQLTLGTFNSS